jgi:hypothetical protein
MQWQLRQLSFVQSNYKEAYLYEPFFINTSRKLALLKQLENGFLDGKKMNPSGRANAHIDAASDTKAELKFK